MLVVMQRPGPDLDDRNREAEPPAAAIPWQARARTAAQRLGLDPRYVRRMRWLTKAQAVRRAGGRVRHHLPFVLLDPETANFTYDIDNQLQLADWVAAVAICGVGAAREYLSEPRADAVLQRRLLGATAGRWLWTHREPSFGKRLGWYALVRALKPRFVVEVGVHDGLGTLALLRALERNLDEDGVSGRLVSFEINPSGGWLVGSNRLWELRRQSSDEGLPEILRTAEPLDMFVYDGWHSFEQERWNLQLAASHLNRGGVLLSDDVQTTQALPGVCAERALEYFEFAETPSGHFYPGSVLGAGRPRAA